MIPTSSRSFGGILVDEEYEKFLESIGGKGIFKSFAAINMEDNLTALRDFEAKKREVTCKEPKNVRIRIPVSLDRLISSKTNCSVPKALQKTIYKEKVTYNSFKFCLPFPVYETFFISFLERITNYIKDIFANRDLKNINEIFVVGGFSECGIIQKALRERFNTLHFIIPADAGIAVLKGAVYLGHLPIAISKAEIRMNKDILSKCTRFAVAAMAFGSTNSGYAYSWRLDWTRVRTVSHSIWPFISKKVQTSLLLYPDQKFCSFGFDAESEYIRLSADSDSDSEDDDKPKPKKCNRYYYFHRFSLTKNVSIFRKILQCFLVFVFILKECRIFLILSVVFFLFHTFLIYYRFPSFIV